MTVPVVSPNSRLILDEGEPAWAWLGFPTDGCRHVERARGIKPRHIHRAVSLRDNNPPQAIRRKGGAVRSDEHLMELEPYCKSRCSRLSGNQGRRVSAAGEKGRRAQEDRIDEAHSHRSI